MSESVQIGSMNVRPIGDKLLVKHYERPEKIGSIHVPEPYRKDRNMALWELVAAAPKVAQALGLTLHEDDIICTQPWRGVHSAPLSDQYGEALFWLQAADVVQVIRWQDAAESGNGTQPASTNP